MSDRTKRKHIQKAMPMLPADGAQPIDYAMGGAGALPPRVLGLAVLAGAVALSVALSLVVAGVVIVGALPMLAVYFALNQPRGVLLTDRGVALFRCGFFNGRPTHLLALDASDALGRRSEHQAGYTKIHVAQDVAWIKDGDVARMTSLVRPPSAAGF